MLADFKFLILVYLEDFPGLGSSWENGITTFLVSGRSCHPITVKKDLHGMQHSLEPNIL
jgi:hypothetical protein